MVLRALLLLACSLLPSALAAQPPPAPADEVTTIVSRLEQAAASGNTAAILALGITPDTVGLDWFANLAKAPPTRFIIKERDRTPLTDTSDRLLLEVFTQHGDQSSITTWRADVATLTPGGPRRIGGMEQLSVVSGLYRLALNPKKQFQVRNLTVRATDLTLELPSGTAFVAETEDGPTAVVLLGRGRMRFSPSDPAERTQVRIFGGEEALETEFDAAFIRVRPGDFPQTFSAAAMIPGAVVNRDLRRASAIFDGYIAETLNLDLTDLSRDRWSLLPNYGDFIAEIRTRRLGSLTYARSTKDAEDISLFERKRRRNIAVYASAQKLASRGRFYSEDEYLEYDVLRYDIDVAFTPERLWLEGTARLKIRVRSYALVAMTLRLAETITVRSVSAAEHGRLLHLRVIGQNSVIINFPRSLARDTEVWLDVRYGGRLAPQIVDREGIVPGEQGGGVQQEEVSIPVEPQFIYSNRSYWYPQNTVSDYATAGLRITVPGDYDVVGTGTETGPPASAPGPVGQGQRTRKLYVYEADRPVRYLSCVISRFNRVVTREIEIPALARGITVVRSTLPPSEDPPDDAAEMAQAALAQLSAVTLNVHANPRQASRGRLLSDRASAIIQYDGSLIGDAPYPTFTLAVTESDLPGGHSPPYFAILNQPLPLSPLVWRNDPVAFDGYGPYFLAHEIAHQWWGQAIGGKNYHEQWISEGFAQYFAALYAAHDRGDNQLTSMLRQMRRWSIEQSEQGPVYLGYRLGHIKSDGRVFRALVYNKGAMVLHMLRRLVGNEAFFAGIRRFYADWKFRKAGTDDFRRAIEAASDRDLSAFFDGWIYGSGIPSLRFTSVTTANEAQLRFEHRGDVIPVPVTVTVSYVDGRTEELVIAVGERVVEQTLPLTGTVRSIDVNRDYAAVAEISR